MNRIVSDNTSWHKNVKVLTKDSAEEGYGDIRDKVMLIKSPPYSANFDPIEQVWRRE